MKSFLALKISNNFDNQHEQLIADDQESKLFETKEKERLEKDKEPVRALTVLPVPQESYQHDPNKPTILAASHATAGRYHDCKQGSDKCPHEKLGDCPDCSNCRYFRHISRNHTDLFCPQQHANYTVQYHQEPIGKGPSSAKAVAVVDGVRLKQRNFGDRKGLGGDGS